MSGFFRRYFAQIDGPEPHLVLHLVDDDLRFAVLFTTDPTSEPREFAGGRAELAAYLEQRGQPGWTHHVLHEAVVDGIELALGRHAIATASSRRRSCTPDGSAPTDGSSATWWRARPRSASEMGARPCASARAG